MKISRFIKFWKKKKTTHKEQSISDEDMLYLQEVIDKSVIATFANRKSSKQQ